MPRKKIPKLPLRVAYIYPISSNWTSQTDTVFLETLFLEMDNLYFYLRRDFHLLMSFLKIESPYSFENWEKPMLYGYLSHHALVYDFRPLINSPQLPDLLTKVLNYKFPRTSARPMLFLRHHPELPLLLLSLPEISLEKYKFIRLLRDIEYYHELSLNIHTRGSRNIPRVIHKRKRIRKRL